MHEYIQLPSDCNLPQSSYLDFFAIKNSLNPIILESNNMYTGISNSTKTYNLLFIVGQ